LPLRLINEEVKSNSVSSIECNFHFLQQLYSHLGISTGFQLSRALFALAH
jgi:hypothetical protein